MCFSADRLSHELRAHLFYRTTSHYEGVNNDAPSQVSHNSPCRYITMKNVAIFFAFLVTKCTGSVPEPFTTTKNSKYMMINYSSSNNPTSKDERKQMACPYPWCAGTRVAWSPPCLRIYVFSVGILEKDTQQEKVLRYSCWRRSPQMTISTYGQRFASPCRGAGE